MTPPTIPVGARTSRISISTTSSTGADVQFRASDGSAGAPVIEGATVMAAEYTAPADGTPVALVAAVGANVCGFATVRMDGTQLSATPSRVPTLVVAIRAIQSVLRKTHWICGVHECAADTQVLLFTELFEECLSMRMI